MKMVNGEAILTAGETEIFKQMLSKELQSLNMVKGMGLPMSKYDSDKLKQLEAMYDMINNQNTIEGE